MDFSKILSAKKAIEDRSKRPDFGPRINYWKPTKPKSEIRIMPDFADEGVYAGQFWREVHQHWLKEDGGKNNVILCEEKTPFLSGEKCDICSYVSELRADKTNIEAQTLANDIKSKVAYLMTIIDMADPEYTAADLAKAMESAPDGEAPFKVGDPKLQIYAAGPTVFNAILGIIQDNSLDITSFKEGHNIFLEKAGTGINTKYTVNLKVKSSNVGEKVANVSLPDLSRIGKTEDDKQKLLASLPHVSVTPALPAPKAEVVRNLSPVGKKLVDKSRDEEGVDEFSERLKASLLNL